MFVVLVMSYAPDGDLFSKLERAHKEQRHIPEEVIKRKRTSSLARVCAGHIRTRARVQLQMIRKWLYQISQGLERNIDWCEILTSKEILTGGLPLLAEASGINCQSVKRVHRLKGHNRIRRDLKEVRDVDMRKP